MLENGVDNPAKLSWLIDHNNYVESRVEGLQYDKVITKAAHKRIRAHALEIAASLLRSSYPEVLDHFNKRFIRDKETPQQTAKRWCREAGFMNVRIFKNGSVTFFRSAGENDYADTLRVKFKDLAQELANGTSGRYIAK